MPRLYREAPLNSIWEGSGNVNALDVLRALAKEPGTAEALMNELALTKGANHHLDRTLEKIGAELSDQDGIQARARRLVELMALALQGSLLVRHSTGAVADAFCASRLGGDWGNAFGTLPRAADLGAIIDRSGVTH